MTKNSLTFIIIILLFSSCIEKNNIKKHDFSIYIPLKMHETKEILDTAELQYYNLEKNLYVAVEKVEKKQYVNIDSLCNEHIISLFENYTKLDTTSYKQKNQISKTIQLEEEGDDATYNWLIKVYENKNFYFIIWTWSANINYAENKYTMKQIVKSFKFLN